MSQELFYADAFAQYQAGNVSEAIEAFRLLCTRHPLEGKFWFGFAASLQENGNYDEALHAWAVTTLLKPSDPYPHFHAAECYLSLQNLEEATLALDEVSKLVDTENPLYEKIALLREQWSL
jgi:type III secretion system low calcium response chaperone LcrH/SycD